MSYLKVGKKKSKNASYLSHEYVITNHGDIVSFAAMLFVLGLLFHGTAPLAQLFILLQHNITVSGSGRSARDIIMFTPGRRDLLTVLFYTLIVIVIHAVIQEYVLDKINKRLHLSKVKHSKVNESGQLALFYLTSAAWGGAVIYRERMITSLPSLWEGYPHNHMSFWFKFFFIGQICYWLHCYPELYFQRVKRDEMPFRLIYYSIYLVCVTGAYVLSLQKLAALLLVVHYSVEFIYHSSRLLHFINKAQLAKLGFLLWDVLFVLVRVLSVALVFITFMFGLERSSRDRVSIREGNFNTKYMRLNCLSFICLLQGYLMWNFINFHIKRINDNFSSRTSRPTSPKKTKRTSDKKSKRGVAIAEQVEANDQNELTEADRNYPDLRRRKQ